MKLKEELLKIAACFERSEIDYALCGGLAVVVHGYPRLTKDIDMLIRPSVTCNLQRHNHGAQAAICRQMLFYAAWILSTSCVNWRRTCKMRSDLVHSKRNLLEGHRFLFRLDSCRFVLLAGSSIKRNAPRVSQNFVQVVWEGPWSSPGPISRYFWFGDDSLACFQALRFCLALVESKFLVNSSNEFANSGLCKSFGPNRGG